MDYNKKIEDINSNLYKNIILELEKQKKKYLSIINNDIPQKIKEIDSLIEYINLYNKKSLETNNEMSLNVTLNNSNKNND